MTIDKFPGKVTQNIVDSSSSRKRWASGKKKNTKILEFIQLRSCRAFFAIPNEGFWTLPPLFTFCGMNRPLMEVDLFSCFFLRTCRANFGSAFTPGDTRIHNKWIWAYLSYKCNTNLQIGNQFGLGFSFSLLLKLIIQEGQHHPVQISFF